MKWYHAILLLCLVLSCQREQRELEPQNNQPDTAQIVQPEVKIKGTWYAPQGRDIDCYQYPLKEAQLLRGSLSGVKGVDALLKLYSGNKTEPFKIINDSLSSLGESFGPLLVQPPLVIVCLHTVNQINQPEYRSLYYEFSASLFQPPSLVEQEPNDTIEQANLLESEAVLGYYSTALSGRDERGYELIERDFYFVEFNQEKRYRLRVELSGVSGIDPILRLHDASGQELRLVDERGQNQGEILLSYGFQGPGRIYFSVTAKDRKINFQEYYELKVISQEHELDYEFEPNDKFSTASALLQEKTHGELADVGDIDIFQLVNQADFVLQYSIVVSSPGKVNLVLETFSAKEERRHIFNDAGLASPEGIANLQLAPQELVYLKISSLDSGSVFPAPYVIEMNSSQPIDFMEREPNDTIRQANEILPETTMIGYLNPNADVDVYQIPQKTRERYKILLDGIANCRLLLRLADKLGVIYEKREARNEGEGISFTHELEPKTYLMVSCSRARDNLFRRPYKLTLERY